MDPKEILNGKRVLIVDDEEDILQLLSELLDMCTVDTAASFEEGEAMLEKNTYDLAILDIMGVKGYDLLKTAKERDVPALMLTAHALSKEDLKRSAQEGASFYAPKDEINRIDVYAADVLEAKQSDRNVWAKWYERLSTFCDRRFGPNWKDEDPAFWNTLIKY